MIINTINRHLHPVSSFGFWKLPALVAAITLAATLPGFSSTEAYVQFTLQSGATVQGDSTSKDFPGTSGWSVLPSVNADVEQIYGTTTGGAIAAGKITFNPLNYQKVVNSMTPSILQAAAAGVPYKTMTMVFARPAAGTNAPFTFFKVVLGLAYVRTQAWGLSEGAASPTENVSLEYGAIHFTFTGTKADGSPAPPIAAGWNRLRNVVWDGVSAP